MLGLGGYGSSSESESGNPKPRHAKQENQGVSKVQGNDQKAFSNVQSAEHVNRPLVGPLQQSEYLYPAKESLSLSTKPSSLTSERSLIRDMTLPPYPNLDIPPSPPGSPPASTQKFMHFLSLKKQGVHFNNKLASSASLRNPSLFTSLRRHAGLEDVKQYSTSLRTETWNPYDLPPWGFRDVLEKDQERIRDEIESAPRDSIDFIQESKNDTPSGPN